MMAHVSVKACSRCHSRKVKCDGSPNCQNCRSAAVECEPYTRVKKSDSLKILKKGQERLRWLEDEISQILNVDIQLIKTGTRLRQFHNCLAGSANNHGSSSTNQSPTDHDSNTLMTEERQSVNREATQEPAVNCEASEISLLALNATGELRYLGPSSGSFFASYATSLARSFGTISTPASRSLVTRNSETGTTVAIDTNNSNGALSVDTVRILLVSFQMWVQPLYPLLQDDYLENLLARCNELQHASSHRRGEAIPNYDVIIFFLVMALGATNLSNTLKWLRENPEQESRIVCPPNGPSANYLYSKAVSALDSGVQHLRPSLPIIQIILLISIFGSYGPVGSSQWQLSGLAMRMSIEIGLHHSARSWQISEHEIDQRSRVFWTAYAIEVSLAYNLGRPPSISEDHITVDFPLISDNNILAFHHVKHRQIQCKIVSLIYCVGKRTRTMSLEQRYQSIRDLQKELDEWKSSLDRMCEKFSNYPYPTSYWERLYHGTTFVLHRSSPFLPQPSSESATQCIRSTGLYIDNMVTILRNSHVPLSWMLVQGVVFAGLTMLITARTNITRLLQHSGVSFLLVEFPTWSRQCSICLAIMNERWNEDLLKKLDAQFEALANDTLKMISTHVASSTSNDITRQNLSVNDEIDVTQVDGTAIEKDLIATHTATEVERTDVLYNNSFMDPENTIDWESLQSFREFLGLEGSQTFWDLFPDQENMDNMGGTTDEILQENSYSSDQIDNSNMSWRRMYDGS